MIKKRFDVMCPERTISDLLAQLSFSDISDRLRHPHQDPQMLGASKNNFSLTLAAHTGYLP